MKHDRRSFLKQAGYTTLGLGCGLPLLSTGCRQSAQGKTEPANQWAMIIDVNKCLKKQEEVRRACVRACHGKHNVPFIPDPDIPDPEKDHPDPLNPEDAYAKEEVKWIWEERYENAFPDQAHTHTMAALQGAPVFGQKAPTLVLCNHCTTPSCTKVCPTGATWKRKSDGVVMMDMHRCIGCRYCMAACPYGARSFNYRDPRERDDQGQFLYLEKHEPLTDYPTRSKGVVEKCTFCTEKIRDPGKDDAGNDLPPLPDCVKAANDVQPGAMTFGRLGDPKIRELLQNNRTICRRISLGTGPNVFYIV